MVEYNYKKYESNTWGLKDMHGNVREWTRSNYVHYPNSKFDGRSILSDQSNISSGRYVELMNRLMMLN